MRTLALLFAISAGACAQDAGPVVTNARFETRAFSGRSRYADSSGIRHLVRLRRQDHSGRPTRTAAGTRARMRLAAGCARIQARCIWKRRPTVDSSVSRGEQQRWRRSRYIRRTVLWMPADFPSFGSRAYRRRRVSHTCRHLSPASGADHILDSAMLAISMHEDAQADDILEQLARPAAAQRIREKAIFWMGANRGARGVAVLKKILDKPTRAIRFAPRRFLRFRSASNRMRST